MTNTINRKISAIFVASVAFLGATIVPMPRAISADAPIAWSVTDQLGKEVHSSSLLGKVTIVNFWATWCLPCLCEIPTLHDLSAKYQKNGLAIVGVTVDSPSSALLAAYVDKFKMNYTVAMANRSMLNGFRVGDNVPVTFIVDQQGRIARKHVGYVKKEDLEKDVRDLLKL